MGNGDALARKRAYIEEHYVQEKPSAVFGNRLKETRLRRGLSQEKLATMLANDGVPMTPSALSRIESSDRKVSLDEALALAAELNTAPSFMLTPPDDVFVRVTDNHSCDGELLRQFLREGFPWHLDAPPKEVADEASRDRFHLNLARLALAFDDEYRSGSKTGMDDAAAAIVREVKRRENEKEASDAS